ncbi:MAG: hypothetical protein PF482_20925 [Desulfobacteraceae bacterium]|nr:hypothetical protein [Desulfobacteraceae bacterium]
MSFPSISQYFPDIPPIERWYDGSEADQSETYDANKQKLNNDVPVRLRLAGS